MCTRPQDSADATLLLFLSCVPQDKVEQGRNVERLSAATKAKIAAAAKKRWAEARKKKE
jgi:hypothetical protein